MVAVHQKARFAIDVFLSQGNAWFFRFTFLAHSFRNRISRFDFFHEGTVNYAAHDSVSRKNPNYYLNINI